MRPRILWACLKRISAGELRCLKLTGEKTDLQRQRPALRWGNFDCHTLPVSSSSLNSCSTSLTPSHWKLLSLFLDSCCTQPDDFKELGRQVADFQREATAAAGSVEHVSREQSSDQDTLFWDGWKIAVWFCPRTPLINAQQIQSEIHWFLLGKTQVAERVCTP